jgi:beta-galactosidase/beta-glucuronidase
MRKKLFSFLLLLVVFNDHAYTQIRIDFNEFWKFHKGDAPNAEAIKFDDNNWRSVELPHDWSIEGPFSQQWASGTGYLPGGIGWYRKHFTCPQRIQSKKVFIYFDGVYNNSEVWLNGHYLGKRPNGYIPFQYEITPYLDKKGQNVIAVKVDHTKFADSRWYTGSGIYRNVYLLASEPVKISLWGVGFTTPQITESNAEAKVSVSVTNASAINSPVQLRARLTDPEGRVVAEANQQITAAAKKDTETIMRVKVTRPRFWSPDHPELYNLTVSVTMKGTLIDEYKTPVGFRTIRFDSNEGFFLNGVAMKLKGVCIHHDAGALGAAVPPEVWERRLKKLKELGANAIRMSHYPHQDYLYDLCDKIGFLVIDEAFDEWEHGKNKWIEGWNVGKPGNDGYHEYFNEWADRDLRDMILRNRNHASIIMWSIGNEIDYPNDPYSHEILNTGRNPQIYGRGYSPDRPPASRLGVLSKRLADVARKADSTRPITAALAGVVMSNTTSYPDNLDVVGYNYQEYRYPEDHQKYPNRIIYGSENGKSMDAWLAVDTNKYISAQFIWTGFDFMGEARRWPSRSSGAGLLDLAGFPKTEFYIRQSWWLDKPVIYMTASRFNQQAGNRMPGIPSWNWQTGDSMLIRAYTNTKEAELFINGRSVGKQVRADTGRREITWQLPYEPGELLAKGYTNGNEATMDKMRTSSAVTSMEAVTDRKAFRSGTKELAHIEIDLKDKDGSTVYNGDNEITVMIEGPARLLGLESGDLNSHEDYKSNKRKAYRGRMIAYVQSTGKAGNVTVTLTSPGLKDHSITINHIK